jgi:CO/xanthine dehydrogenase Mo-binding subunit
MLGHVTGTSTYFDDHKLQGMLISRYCAARTPTPACAASTRRKRNARPAFGASSRGRRAGQSQHLLSLINFGKDDEPSLAVDKVRYKGEPIVAIVADSPREAFEALAKGAGRL